MPRAVSRMVRAMYLNKVDIFAQHSTYMEFSTSALATIYEFLQNGVWCDPRRAFPTTALRYLSNEEMNKLLTETITIPCNNLEGTEVKEFSDRMDFIYVNRHWKFGKSG